VTLPSETVAVPPWIKRIADDERNRDAARVKENDAVAQKADLIRRHGRRLIDELCKTITRDLDAFRAEFPDDRTRDIGIESMAADGGFVVRRSAPAALSLTVRPNLDAAAIACQYRFTLANGLAREDGVDVLFADNGGETLQMRDHATGQVFPTPDALSEFLLVPVFTARRR
jgi:hypothetical protein